MSRGRVGAVALMVGLLAMGGSVLADPAKDDDAGILKDETHFRSEALKNYEGGNKAGSALNMEVVGHNDLGNRGYNADVWVHDGYAYVGT
jgi:hypothetical protein